MATPKIIVVGGGLAGLAAVSKIAEMGANVDLFSIVPVKRSHSVCAQGGINAAKNLKGEGDSTWQHLDDTVYGGDFLGNQPPIKAMCDGFALDGSAHLPCRRNHHRHGRHWRNLWQEHQLGCLYRIGTVRALSAGLLLREWRIHPGPSYVDSWRRQAAVDVRVGARRRGTRLGAEDAW